MDIYGDGSDLCGMCEYGLHEPGAPRSQFTWTVTLRLRADWYAYRPVVAHTADEAISIAASTHPWATALYADRVKYVGEA